VLFWQRMFMVPCDVQKIQAISFNGMLTATDLKDFFLTQDIIISPNRHFLLHPGNFDGFPTGCCVEASLSGVAVVCSDELKLNRYHTNGIDIVICDPTPEVIVKAVRELIRDPDLLKSIGARGQSICHKIFDPRRQLGQRSDLLGKALKRSETEWESNSIAEHIWNIEKDWAARGEIIAGLKQALSDQAEHIQKFLNSCMWKMLFYIVTFSTINKKKINFV